MATVNLGAIKFNWKGAYNNSTAYVVDDVVSSGGSSYVCILASQGNAVSNGTYWNIMSSAGTNGTNGTNGTDVGTVITTQGDILYRDGSGLQRLPKGTAGQVLQMNSGATAPEYGTVSSDFVKLGSITASNIGTASFNNLFSSEYKVYKIFMKRVHGDTDNRFVKVRYRNGGGQIQSAYYKNFHYGGYFGSGANNQLLNRTWSGDHINLTLNGLDALVKYGMTAEFTLFEPQATDVHKNHICQVTHDVYDQTLWYSYSSTGGFINTGALTGIDFFMNSGNISGIFTLYGLKE